MTATGTIGVVNKRETPIPAPSNEEVKPFSVKKECELEDRNSLHQMHIDLTMNMSDKDAARRKPQDKHLPMPKVWVSKWVDYSKKYGLGYQLSDGTFGVFFNDATKMLLDKGSDVLEYVERVKTSENVKQDIRNHFRMEAYPADLKKKVTLLHHFQNFLRDNEQAHCTTCNESAVKRSNDTLDGGYVRKWMLTRHSIIFRLSNNNFQVNFFDGTEVFLWADKHLVTYVSKAQTRKTYEIGDILSFPELAKRVKYVKEILSQLIGRT